MANAELDTYSQLRNLSEFTDITALSIFATMVDYAGDIGSLELTVLVSDWFIELESRNLTEAQRVNLFYCVSNLWAIRYQLEIQNTQGSWDWEQSELQNQIIYLRKAIVSESFAHLPKQRKCEIFTNLANAYDTVGRFVEAREYYSKAIRLDENFWMARGNRGRAAMYYADKLYDFGHRNIFAMFACKDICLAVQSIKDYPNLGDASLLPFFENAQRQIAEKFDVKEIEELYCPEEFSWGNSKEEIKYRKWVAKNKAFLNPLNDFETRSIIAQDVLSLPSFATNIDEPPVLLGFFNQIKQEYASARFLLYEGINSEESHFSDKGVGLVNTLDYPQYGIATEKIKIAFRTLYSIFDKIAFFLNYYLKLGVDEQKISFRNIWFNFGKKPKNIKDVFNKSKNLAFRGLFWMSKDFFEEDFKEFLEPDAIEINVIRNHLEHKYLKVKMYENLGAKAVDNYVGPFYDNLSYKISKDRIEKKTLELLKRARSAIINLSLGMNFEERKREALRPENMMIAPMTTGMIDDEWKI